MFVGFVLFSTIFSKGITKLQTTYGEKLQILSTYADQILLTEQKEMQSHILQKLKTELTSQNQTASQAVRQLSKLMNALDQRSNLLISTILNGLIFWELRQVMRIEKWKEIHASDLPRWIEPSEKLTLIVLWQHSHIIIRITSILPLLLNLSICRLKLWGIL